MSAAPSSARSRIPSPLAAAAAAAAATAATASGAAAAAPGGFVDYETFGAVPVSGRALFQLLKRGEPALLYPGGVREAFKSTKAGESYKLFWPEGTSDFARVAARFGATIVPVAAVGAEESFEMILDADELLALPVVGDRLRESAKSAPVGRAGERFVGPLSVPTLPDRFYFCFGRPIETDAVDASDAAACEELYSEVQRELEGDLAWLLARRTEDPYRAPVPRVPVEASWEWKKQAPSFKVEDVCEFWRVAVTYYKDRGSRANWACGYRLSSRVVVITMAESLGVNFVIKMTQTIHRTSEVWVSHGGMIGGAHSSCSETVIMVAFAHGHGTKVPMSVK